MTAARTPAPPGYPDRWNVVALLVSLDMAEPFLAPIGLALADPAALRARTRALILANRATPAASLRDAFLGLVAEVEGAGAVTRAERWGERTFALAAPDGTQAFMWRTALGRGLRGGLYAAAGVPEAALTTMRAAFADWTRDPAYEAAIEAFDEDALSPWDADMFARHRFAEEAADHVPSHPLLWIGETHRVHALHRFFAAAREALGPEGLARFGRIVARQVADDPGLSQGGPLALPEAMPA